MRKVKRVNGNRIRFYCPACECSHVVELGEGKWKWNGDPESPTIEPSVAINVGSKNPQAVICHGTVTKGKIQYCKDCTHGLANQTVELPEIPY